MKRCFFSPDDGRFLRSVESQNQEVLDRNTPEGSVFVDGDYDLNYYLEGGVVVKQPEKPSELHMFDFQSKTWKVSALAVKSKRVLLLEHSDWTDTLSAQSRLGEVLYAAWQTYRQALRDLPEQTGFPEEVVWPIPPT
jgi:hypothetical protein